MNTAGKEAVELIKVVVTYQSHYMGHGKNERTPLKTQLPHLPVNIQVKEYEESSLATYLYNLSCDEKPTYLLCPSGSDTRCKFRKAETLGKSFKDNISLPEAVMETIKPTYTDLAHPDLLRKCLHGRIKNPNAAFNNIIWTRVQRNVGIRGVENIEMGSQRCCVDIQRWKNCKNKSVEATEHQPCRSHGEGTTAFGQNKNYLATHAKLKSTTEKCFVTDLKIRNHLAQ
ncbi:hypothetical protein PR048_012164 [Dryococelus australis]|uniref:Uncharacterized protein n=1 Tax=Dryococelus australis TaxID=614101 RepID=A0ABQ9HNL8_9NEOP|nr:hypothetical protein PR048_012164 [Dryococelus australis]